jgi:hypothetical protein
MDDYIVITDINNKDPIQDANNISLVINTSKFIHDMVVSYKNTLNIFQQFAADFNRLDIYINDEQYTDIDRVLRKLLTLKLNYIKTKNTQRVSFFTFIVMLCCQSSFFPSFLFLHKNFADCENIHATSNNNCGKRKHIKIYEKIDENGKRKGNYVKFIASYALINIKTNTEISIVDTETVINLISNTSVVNFCIHNTNKHINT